MDFVLFVYEGLKRSVFFDAKTGHKILGAKAAAWLNHVWCNQVYFMYMLTWEVIATHCFF